jgi:hypothetical protein
VLFYYVLGCQNCILEGPTHISHWFPKLPKTPFENVIDCAFNTYGTEVFMFSGKHCAIIDYAPQTKNPKLLVGSVPINVMFPYLAETPFEDGIDAAIKSTRNNVFLFKMDKCAGIDSEFEEFISYLAIDEFEITFSHEKHFYIFSYFFIYV